MNKIFSVLRGFSEFSGNYKTSFFNLLLIGLTAAGEGFLQGVVFNCPVNHEDAQEYALLFFSVPALLLFVLGILVNNMTWYGVHGLCPGCSGMDTARCPNSLRYVGSSLMRALVMPFAWIFTALLDGDYIACMKSSTPADKTTEDYLKWYTRSQLCSWYFLAFIIGVGFLGLCCFRCCDRSGYLQSQYEEYKRDIEKDVFDLGMQGRANQIAVHNVKAFLEREEIHEKDWEKISSMTEKERKSETATGLTDLEKWVIENGKKDQSSTQRLVVLPPILGTGATENPQSESPM